MITDKKAEELEQRGLWRRAAARWQELLLNYLQEDDRICIQRRIQHCLKRAKMKSQRATGFAPIFPDICYHLTHYKPAAADIPVASDNPVHYADAIRYNARTPLQGSLLPLTRLVWA